MEEYINQISTSLKTTNPYLILLFGSCATETTHKDSDIDLLVVTKDNYIPQTFKERTKLYLKIKHSLAETNKKVAIDLLVYTIPMYQNFLKLDSSFSREITKKGRILYENNYTEMA